MGQGKPSDTQEILSRSRRIETRLTQLMIRLGVDTTAQKPEFDPVTSSVRVPSVHSSLHELLDSVPKEWKKPVRVCIGDDLLVVVQRTGAD